MTVKETNVANEQESGTVAAQDLVVETKTVVFDDLPGATLVITRNGNGTQGWINAALIRDSDGTQLTGMGILGPAEAGQGS